MFLPFILLILVLLSMKIWSEKNIILRILAKILPILVLIYGLYLYSLRLEMTKVFHLLNLAL